MRLLLFKLQGLLQRISSLSEGALIILRILQKSRVGTLTFELHNQKRLRTGVSGCVSTLSCVYATYSNHCWHSFFVCRYCMQINIYIISEYQNYGTHLVFLCVEASLLHSGPLVLDKKRDSEPWTVFPFLSAHCDIDCYPCFKQFRIVQSIATSPRYSLMVLIYFRQNNFWCNCF